MASLDLTFSIPIRTKKCLSPVSKTWKNPEKPENLKKSRVYAPQSINCAPHDIHSQLPTLLNFLHRKNYWQLHLSVNKAQTEPPSYPLLPIRPKWVQLQSYYYNIEGVCYLKIFFIYEATPSYLKTYYCETIQSGQVMFQKTLRNSRWSWFYLCNIMYKLLASRRSKPLWTS